MSKPIKHTVHNRYDARALIRALADLERVVINGYEVEWQAENGREGAVIVNNGPEGMPYVGGLYDVADFVVRGHFAEVSDLVRDALVATRGWVFCLTTMPYYVPLRRVLHANVEDLVGPDEPFESELDDDPSCEDLTLRALVEQTPSVRLEKHQPTPGHFAEDTYRMSRGELLAMFDDAIARLTPKAAGKA